MKAVRQWYRKRIARGELTLSGWSRRHSQLLRFEANRIYMERFLPQGKWSVADFWCGTADFRLFMGSRISTYCGIEMRRDARDFAKAFYQNTPGTLILQEVPETSPFGDADVLVANAVYGFDCQDPVSDFKALATVFKPRLVIADFFSRLRDCEPGVDGYRPFDPAALADEMRRAIGWKRFVVDHSFMPHVFTLVLIKGETPWEKKE